MTADPPAPDAPLFSEPGASLGWLLGGPIAAAAMIFVQVSSGAGFNPVVPLGLLVVLTFVFGLQVKAARMHTSVELTREYLRQGVETILLREIVSVYPESPDKPASGPLAGVSTLSLLRGRVAIDPDEAKGWQSARSLGELNGVPKGRKGIGLKLTKGRTAQAWARNHEELRRLLIQLVEERDA
ncbi:MAG: DUF3093 domain-containing protein [Mycobacterium sp.]|nr:DUF3093 domain-containing protein [Mycobacterium sp.]